MARLRVLMIGPGEPNALNSGLGVAAKHIARELAAKTELTLIQPEMIDETAKDFTRGIKGINTEHFSESGVMAELSTINVRSSIAPYFYPCLYSSQAEGIRNQQDSPVKKELDSFTAQVVEASEALEFDVIYAHDWTAALAGVRIKQLRSKPLVVHIHSLDYDRNPARSWVHEVENNAFEEADAIIGVSDYTHRMIAEQYEKAAAEKIHTVYNGNSILAKPRRKVKKVFKEKLILFVGRLSGQKGPSIFMDIAERVLKKAPSMRFVLAGQGDRMRELIHAAAAKRMGSRFHFTGQVSSAQILALYDMADLYCMPSVSEPFGLTAVEAAYAGLPVILSMQSGAAEVLPGALCSDHWEVDGFVEQILSILKHDKKRRKLIADNKRALKSLTWSRTADQILEIFENAGRDPKEKF